MDVIKIKTSWMGLKIALIPGGGGIICEPKTGQRKDKKETKGKKVKTCKKKTINSMDKTF